MKCPLLQRYLIEGENQALEVFDDCLKEECAWWVKASQSCAMEAIPRIIGYLGGELQNIDHRLDALTGIKK